MLIFELGNHIYILQYSAYKTLSIAIVIASLVLLFVNTLGLLATIYAFGHSRKYEESQIVTRA
jgi:uncharacterized membrane protein